MFFQILNLDIDIDSEDYAVTDVSESQIKHDIEKTDTVPDAQGSVENMQTSKTQQYDEIDSKEKASPEKQENDSTRKKDIPELVKPKLHIDNGKNRTEHFIKKTTICWSRFF